MNQLSHKSTQRQSPYLAGDRLLTLTQDSFQPLDSSVLVPGDRTSRDPENPGDLRLRQVFDNYEPHNCSLSRGQLQERRLHRHRDRFGYVNSFDPAQSKGVFGEDQEIIRAGSRGDGHPPRNDRALTTFDLDTPPLFMGDPPSDASCQTMLIIPRQRACSLKTLPELAEGLQNDLFPVRIRPPTSEEEA